jgi:hypothetical protein
MKRPLGKFDPAHTIILHVLHVLEVEGVDLKTANREQDPSLHAG